MSNHPQTRTLLSYFASLPDGAPAKVVGQGLSILDVDQFAPVKSVQAGVNVQIDQTDPQNPVVSALGTGLGDVTGPASAVNNRIALFDGATGKLIKDGGALLTDFLESVVAGTGITIDVADPQNPVINANAASAVTSVNMTVPTGLSVTGSPITSTGTFAVTYTAGYQGYLTTEASKLSGISAGADVTGTAIHGATGKTTPVDADELGLIDSAASNVLKKLTWANLKATVRTYLLGVANIWSAPQMGTITPLSVASGLVAWDAASGNDFEVTLTANAVWQFPSNASTHVGQKGRLLIKQNATGGWTFGVASGFKVLGSASLPAILTAANAESYAAYEIIASGTVLISLAGVGG